MTNWKATHQVPLSLTSSGTLPIRHPSGRLIATVFVAILLCDALDAYNLGPVPFQWMAQVGLIAVALFIALNGSLRAFPGRRLLLLLFCWTLLVTLVNILFRDCSNLMPPLATTPYFAFISLRLLTIIAFIAAVYLVYWLLANGHREAVIRGTVIVGTIISIAAIYIYIAHTHGLPEFPRNRLGTGGGEQAITFTYAFNRALGTFREPGLLAEWLVVPFFLSLIYRGKLMYFHTIVIGSTVLLTGSLAGILGILLGVATGLLITNPLRLGNVKLLLGSGLMFTTCLAIFHYVVVSNVPGGSSLPNVIAERVAPILFEQGMRSTDRDYVYAYLSHAKVPYLGVGVGNSNLIFTRYLGANDIASLLSLYFNFMVSTGLIGLALLCCFLAYPVVAILVNKGLKANRDTLWMVSAYIAWLIIFGVQAEEFCMMFGIIFALVAYEISGGDKERCLA